MSTESILQQLDFPEIIKNRFPGIPEDSKITSNPHFKGYPMILSIERIEEDVEFCLGLHITFYFCFTEKEATIIIDYPRENTSALMMDDFYKHLLMLEGSILPAEKMITQMKNIIHWFRHGEIPQYPDAQEHHRFDIINIASEWVKALEASLGSIGTIEKAPGFTSSDYVHQNSEYFANAVIVCSINLIEWDIEVDEDIYYSLYALFLANDSFILVEENELDVKNSSSLKENHEGDWYDGYLSIQELLNAGNEDEEVLDPENQKDDIKSDILS